LCVCTVAYLLPGSFSSTWLPKAFMSACPKKRKNHHCLLALLGSVRTKFACKILVKLTPSFFASLTLSTWGWIVWAKIFTLPPFSLPQSSLELLCLKIDHPGFHSPLFACLFVYLFVDSSAILLFPVFLLGLNLKVCFNKCFNLDFLSQ